MKKLLWASVGIAFVAVVAFLLVRMATTQPRNGLRDAEIARVARRDIGSLVKATGIIKPMIGAQVRVGSRISGVVSRLFVKVGDRVRQGQALAELDARQLAAQQAEAAAALQVTEAELRYAEADLRRKRELMADQIIAQSELEVAERAFAVSERQRREAQARLEYADAQLDYARISAPIGGVVASVTTQEGETVAASLAAPTFVTLVDLARLEVWAYVDETDIGRIHAGQKARFTVDTYPGHEFDGRVATVYPNAEIRDNVVNYIAVVRFAPSPERLLRPEMTTTVKIALQLREKVLAVPRRAVRREGGRTFVWCRRGGTLERRFVTTGISDESYYEILDGLREGDEVVTGDVNAI